MNEAKRILIILALLVVAVAVGLVVFWYVQTRNAEITRSTVVEVDGPIEIRGDPGLTVAEVTRSGSRNRAMPAGFGPFGRYIFASDRPGAAPPSASAAGGTMRCSRRRAPHCRTG